MEFVEVLARRHSCRAYAAKPVEREKITACIEAARVAPSGCNLQPWTFIAVDDRELCGGIAQALEHPEIKINLFAKQVPAYIVIVQHPPRRELLPFQKIIQENYDSLPLDMGIAAEHICLRATDLGLGSVMMGWFDEERIKALLHVPEERRVAMVVALGYPAKEGGGGPRRYAMEDVARWNRYTDKGGEE